MKLLFSADTHGNDKAHDIIKDRAKDVDGIICAGDISVMERGLKKTMKKLNSIGKPVLMIHGNHEDEEGLKELCEKHENITFLHKGVYNVGDYVFLGYGGGGFSTNDPRFEEVAEKFFKPEVKDKKRIIMVTHGLPHFTIIDNMDGDFRGNKSYRKFMDEVQPHLFVSGHLHETAGKHEKIGRTLVLNPGPHGFIVDI